MDVEVLKQQVLSSPSVAQHERILRTITQQSNWAVLFPLLQELSKHEHEALRTFAALGLGHLSHAEGSDPAAVFSALEGLSQDWSGKVITYGLNKALVMLFEKDAESLRAKIDPVRGPEANPVLFKSLLIAYARFVAASQERNHLECILAILDQVISTDNLVVNGGLPTVLNVLGRKFPLEVTERLKRWAGSGDVFAFDVLRNALDKQLGKTVPPGVKQTLLEKIDRLATERIKQIFVAPPNRGGVPTRHVERSVHTLLHRINVWFLPFSWGANPYRGCFHGCEYCTARSSHEYLGNTRDEFERIIYVKVNASQALDRDLSSPRWKKTRNKLVNLGSVTDPYQPIEERVEITRKVLETFLVHRNPVAITTKSDLVVRDIDLLKALGPLVNVVFSIPSLDQGFATLLEKRAPSIARRLAAIEKLKAAGVVVGVLIIPIVPYISDDKGELRKLVKELHDLRVDYVIPDILNLRGEVRTRMRYFLERHKPTLVDRYDALYTHGKHHDYADRAYMKDMFDFMMKDCLKAYNLNDYSRMIKGKWD